MSGSLRLSELTREEVQAIAPGATVVLPTASTEQHGPHLPLLTDYALGEAVALRAVERAAESIPVVMAPVLPYGFSSLHQFACALSLKSSTFISVLNDLADSLVAAGFRRLFLLNCHGGNEDCVRVVARDLVVRHQVAVAACNYWHAAEAAVKEAGLARPGHFFIGHAGAAETSLMMAVAPGLVRTDRLPSKNPDPPRLKDRVVARGVMMLQAGDWVRVGGYTDAASDADPEWGGRLLDVAVQAVAEAIVAFHRAAWSV